MGVLGVLNTELSLNGNVTSPFLFFGGIVSEVLIGEMYEHEKELLTVKAKTKISQIDNGHPFTYPAIILENSKGETKVIPEYQMDRLTKYHPTHNKIENHYEEFLHCYNLATEGEFTKEINSFNSEQYVRYSETVNTLVDNYDQSFMSKGLSDKSKDLLKSFTMMLLVTIEMSSARIREGKEKDT